MGLEDEIRRLRSRVATLEVDKSVLEERLAWTSYELNRVRAKLLDARPGMQTAPPGSRKVHVEPVTAAELTVALAVLQRVRPMPVA